MLKPHIPTYINNPWDKVVEKPKLTIKFEGAEACLFTLNGIRREVALINDPQIVDYNSCRK